MLENGIMSSKDFDSILRNINTQEFKSSLNCFNDHKGFRRGELHTILGPKGGGKSTFVKTSIVEILKNKKRVYTFLSEEKTDIYKMPVYRCFNMFFNDEEKTNSFLSNLFIESQFDLDEKNRELVAYCERLEFIINEYGIDAIIIDNFTTSFLGRANINQQALAIEKFKEIASKYNIVVIIVLHTAKGTDVYKGLIDGENVRGNATSVNMGSYNYVISAFFRANPTRVFITIDKSRYHRKANKKVYEMYYDEDMEIFIKDIKSSYDEILNLIKELTKQKSAKKYGSQF